MMQPLSPRGQRGAQQASTQSVPAPVGGWNARDALASMPETDAVLLENWFPRASSVDLRPGAINYVTGFADAPRDFLVWNGPTTQKLFASTANEVFDVTTGGPVGTAVLSNPLRGYVNFTTAGGHFMFAIDQSGGTDLHIYDGTTWDTAAITGMPLDTVVSMAVMKRRVWFAHRNSSKAYYLDTGVIAGAATQFELGQVFGRGGSLVAMANWTIDGGDGQDDYAVFASSQGELAVYKGTDPSTLATWTLVGVYYIGEPLNYQCFAKLGGDLVYLCQNGLFPLSKALLSSTVNFRSALTSKIDTAFADAVSTYSSPSVSGVNNDTWSVCVYPTGSFLIINIPITSGYSVQYVMNTITGAWTTFTGWNSRAFEVFKGKLYLTTPTSVAEGWTGTSDFGANIVARAQQAYTALRAPGRNKHPKLLRPIMTVGGALQLRISLNADYAAALQYSLRQLFAGNSSLWDSSLWDTAVWNGTGGRVLRDWMTAFCKEGFVFSFGLQVATLTSTIEWVSTDYAYTNGKIL